MPTTIKRNTVRSTFKKLATDDNRAIVRSARKGLKPEIFYEFAGTINMPEKNLAEMINLSSRTISNYKLKGKNIDPVYAEHLLKLIALFEKGEEIFGNIDEFNYWLNKPFWNSKEKPMDWLITSGGVDLVMEEINKLAEGYPV